MKTSNIQQGRAHPEAILRGWVSNKRAGSTGITVGDSTTTGNGITTITVVGGAVIDNGDGSVVIVVEVPTDLDGLIPVTTTDTVSVDTGTPPGVTITSLWGVDGSGLPYYDTAGATAGEEAALYWDPSTDHYALVAYDF